MRDPQPPQLDIESLSTKLAETEETLRAISSGQVDALIVNNEIHLLKGSAHPYRIIKEEVLPGVVLTEDGTLLFYNRSFLKLIGLPENSPVSSLRRFLPPQHFEKFQIAFTAGMAVESHESLALYSSEGVYLPVDMVFHPVGIDGLRGCCLIVTSQVDGTRASTSLEQITESMGTAVEMDELKYRMLANFIPQIIWTARPDGYRDYFNDRWLEMTGMTLERSQGRGWEEALHPADRASAIEHWLTCVRTGQVYQREVRFRTSTGEHRWFLVRAVPAKDQSGKILKWFGTYTDIEEQVAAKEQVKAIARELSRSNEALSQFASIASHDLQEPLHKISSYTDLLSGSARLDDREKRYLQHIQGAALRMGRLIADILDYAKVASGPASQERVDLRAVVGQVLEDLETRVREKKARITVDGLATVVASRSQMRQLFQNLISNALKFSRKGEAPRIAIESRILPDERIEICVKDNGVGFDDSLRDRLFQPFQRLHGKSEFEGSGFGLAVCKRIVDAHGGSISVESRPGDGAIFRVLLPLPPA